MCVECKYSRMINLYIFQLQYKQSLQRNLNHIQYQYLLVTKELCFDTQWSNN